MNLGRIAVPALLVGAGIAVLASCTSEPDENATPFEKLTDAADDAAYSDDATTRLVNMVQLSGYDQTSAASIIRTAGKETQTDDALLAMTRIGITTGYTPESFQLVAEAADKAAATDESAVYLVGLAASMLGDTTRSNPAMDAAQIIRAAGDNTYGEDAMLDMVEGGLAGRFNGSDFTLLADASDKAAQTDAAAVTLMSMAEYSTLPAAKAASVIDAAGRSTQTDESLLSLVNSQLVRVRPGEPDYPKVGPDEPTSTGDDPA